MRTRHSRILLAAAMLLLATCQGKDVFEPGWVQQVGEVDPELSSVQLITVPATATVNVPFTVTVRTVGSRTCTRAFDADVAVSGLDVDITPFVQVARAAPYCSSDLTAFEHPVSVTIGSAGQARIRLHAHTRTGAEFTYDVLLTVQ